MLKGNVTTYASNVTLSGNYCQAASALPQVIGTSGTYDGGEDVFDSGQYLIVTDGATAGSVAVAILSLSPVGSPVWVTATTPNSSTGTAFTLIPSLAAATTYNGSLGVVNGVFFPCLGIRLAVTLSAGTITTMQLYLTRR